MVNFKPDLIRWVSGSCSTIPRRYVGNATHCDSPNTRCQCRNSLQDQTGKPSHTHSPQTGLSHHLALPPATRPPSCTMGGHYQQISHGESHRKLPALPKPQVPWAPCSTSSLGFHLLLAGGSEIHTGIPKTSVVVPGTCSRGRVTNQLASFLLLSCSPPSPSS